MIRLFDASEKTQLECISRVIRGARCLQLINARRMNGRRRATGEFRVRATPTSGSHSSVKREVHRRRLGDCKDKHWRCSREKRDRRNEEKKNITKLKKKLSVRIMGFHRTFLLFPVQSPSFSSLSLRRLFDERRLAGSPLWNFTAMRLFERQT